MHDARYLAGPVVLALTAVGFVISTGADALDARTPVGAVMVATAVVAGVGLVVGGMHQVVAGLILVLTASAGSSLLQPPDSEAVAVPFGLVPLTAPLLLLGMLAGVSSAVQWKSARSGAGPAVAGQGNGGRPEGRPPSGRAT